MKVISTYNSVISMGIVRTTMGRRIINEDEHHRIERERVAKLRQRALTQNQKDAVLYLKAGGYIRVQGRRATYHGLQSSFLLQRNTFTSLADRGLLKLDHSDEEADYYTIKEEGSK